MENFIFGAVHSLSSNLFNFIERENLNTGVARKQSTPTFPKNEQFLPPDKHTSLNLKET